jgi:hypothetical protein
MVGMERDPWVAGKPIPGVAITYNSLVDVVGGQYVGEVGVVVGLQLAPDPIYTVELADNPNAEIPQSMLRAK